MRALTARLALAAACLAAVCAAASCGSSGSSDENKPVSRIDLVIGNIAPLTGPDAGLGVSAQKAAQLAVEEVNDAIGEADVEHSVEIVHQDETARGAPRAATTLLDDGASCVLGPWSRRALDEVARQLDAPRNALLISPQAGVRRAPGPLGSRPVVGVPGLGPQETLSSENKEQDRDDPSASFARLYASTDPQIGPARTTDARQFDVVVLCYLAAVAAGSSEGKRMSGRIVPPARMAFTWLQLSDAIEALEQGERIVYAGITTELGIQPSAPPKSSLP